MTYEEFKENLCNKITACIPNDYHLKLDEVIKNNSTRLDALQISCPAQSLSPCIYLNGFYSDYQDGVSIDTIVDEILELYEQHSSTEPINFAGFQKFEQLKSHIVYRLVNYEQNKELLKEVPHIPYLDLAITFHYLVIPTKDFPLQLSPDVYTSILIRNTHFLQWNISVDELYLIACKNTPQLLPYRIRNLAELISDYVLSQKDSKDFFSNEMKKQVAIDTPFHTTSDFPMYVLTNLNQLNGAACLLYPNLLSECANRLQTNLYVIPSSIHEVLLVPDDLHPIPSELQQMVSEVNETQVAPEEILSNHVYYFSRKAKQMTLAH